jgi:hypothetical protein
MGKLVIELELRDGGLEFERRPDMVAKGYDGDLDPLAQHWIGHYLDGGGEQEWLSMLEMCAGDAPGAAYAGELRLVEVMPDGRRLVRWDWKAKPQVPPTDEEALLRSIAADLEALTEEQRQAVISRFVKST